MKKGSPGRPRKYGEALKKFQTALPESIYDWLYWLKDMLGVSFPELFTFIKKIIEGQIDKLEVLAENKKLRDYIKQLEEENKSLHLKVERLEGENRRLRLMLKAKAKDELYIFEKVNEIFSNAEEFKLAAFLKKLGFKETGDRLEGRAVEFVGRYFREEGNILVSEELGLVIVKDSDKVLAWKVRRLDADSFRGKVKEVVAYG
ncbi:hypothetical protein [Pyrococcus kukulkanii]|uniref:hypothetical protein n=1 Tax=Pyrococcus kukulkanii TaxID=1609559 RepID=UPI00356467F1